MTVNIDTVAYKLTFHECSDHIFSMKTTNNATLGDETQWSRHPRKKWSSLPNAQFHISPPLGPRGEVMKKKNLGFRVCLKAQAISNAKQLLLAG